MFSSVLLQSVVITAWSGSLSSFSLGMLTCYHVLISSVHKSRRVNVDLLYYTYWHFHLIMAWWNIKESPTLLEFILRGDLNVCTIFHVCLSNSWRHFPQNVKFMEALEKRIKGSILIIFLRLLKSAPKFMKPYLTAVQILVWRTDWQQPTSELRVCMCEQCINCTTVVNAQCKLEILFGVMFPNISLCGLE